MNLDEMKTRTSTVKAPGFTGHDSQRTVDELIATLKLADEHERKKLRRMMFFSILAGLLFAFTFIMTWLQPLSADKHYTILLRGSLSLWFLLIGLSAWYMSRRHAKLDYSEPLALFLAKAEKRYRFMTTQGILVGLGILPIAVFSIIMAGEYLSGVFRRYVSQAAAEAVPLFWYLFIVMVFILGWLFTYRDWQRDKAVYWREIKTLLAKLQAAETKGIE